MSNGNLKQVMTRINGAEVNSPIAVFQCAEPGMLNAVFESTVMTQKIIEQNPLGLIGIFNNRMNMKKVALTLDFYIHAAA